MPKLTKLKATINNTVYVFKGTDGLYDGAIAIATGITVAGDADKDLPEYAVKELLQAGIVRRVSATVRRTADNSRTTLRMLVAKDKISTALDDLVEKNVAIPGGKAGQIRSVGFPRRVVSRG